MLEIAVAPTLPSRILVFTTGGVYRSEDGGATFVPSGTGLFSAAGMQEAAFDPTDANRVWATGPSSTLQTTWLSTNGGASWTEDDAGINNVVSQIAVDSDGTAYTGQTTMWRRGKAEATWSSMSLTQQVRAIAVRTAGQPFVAYGPNGAPMDWFLTRFTSGPGWLGVSPVSPNPSWIYGMTFGYDGTLWKATGIGVKKGAPANVFAFDDGGLSSATQDVALEIGYQGKLWAASNDVYRSTDNGVTWRATGFGASAQAVGSTGTGNTFAGNLSGLYIYTDTPPQADDRGGHQRRHEQRHPQRHRQRAEPARHVPLRLRDGAAVRGDDHRRGDRRGAERRPGERRPTGLRPAPPTTTRSW